MADLTINAETIAKIDIAIASNVMEIEVDGIRTRFRSVDEMMRARQHITDVLAAASSVRKPATRYFRFGTHRD